MVAYKNLSRSAFEQVKDLHPFTPATTAHIIAGHQKGLTTTNEKILQGQFTTRGQGEQAGKIVAGKTILGFEE
jgi:hypothetical protein